MKRILVISIFLLNCLLIVGFSTTAKASSLSTICAALDYQKIPSFPPIPFDSTLVAPFFDKYPKFKYLKPEVIQLYRKHNYEFLWYDSNGINEFASLLYNKVNNLEQEGIKTRVPYAEKLQTIFQDLENMEKSDVEVELLMSSLYFFYANRVFKGLDAKQTVELGWYLPRKKQSYVNRLDSLLQDPSLINKQLKDLPGQYYLLKDVLQNYRDIEKNGGWDPIVFPKTIKSLKPGDTSDVILQVRKRLFITRDLKIDSQKNIFDNELLAGIIKYKERNAFTTDSLLLPKHISSMNINVHERIKTLMVNMERSRWISLGLTKTEQSIVVNIPSFTLTYFKEGKPVLVSKVVVGKSMNKTAVFSGQMNQIVFSPYWNIPPSILRKEILPAIAKNSNYLAKHDMEWVGNRVRQRPGEQNALGKVKFVFPNSHIIYMHDTPSKTLFDKEQRAFSHGCIRVARPRDLAIEVLEGDTNWTVEKIDAAMNREVEKTYNLKTRIPVYIGYFTAWVDREGQIYFYEDIYGHDERLSKILLSDL
ncbi:Murein L,D-transpeptidase YcbB/YkuD [Flavobacterium gillisiae]|uniref:Murein L,D-transpeptidase YcbB/YkuD n=1 Tax=Flavobacterium gillisiae TaxID=150146 RepID=A0A1H3YLM4_9FLAO|nr:L,D-transpeptidase family protein [Flavobacterium gillisiae]SEA12455.1 Murein L,D-transpeptidase YcbB/YkuD [Flavobacterium gillisiae]